MMGEQFGKTSTFKDFDFFDGEHEGQYAGLS